MIHSPRGLCVIINNVNFRKSAMRKGSGEDEGKFATMVLVLAVGNVSNHNKRFSMLSDNDIKNMKI